jgi:hypothetical protein
MPISLVSLGRQLQTCQARVADSVPLGALVLAHSLRDAGTTKKLAILVTLDTVSADVVTQLKASFLDPKSYLIWSPVTNYCARLCTTM